MINIMINEYVEICFSLNFVFITFYVFIILNYAPLNKNVGTATGYIYAKNVLEFILMIKFWDISIILYIYQSNNNLQINNRLRW